MAVVSVSTFEITHAQNGPNIGYLYTYATYGSHTLKKPTGIFIASGYLYIADTGNNRIALFNGGSVRTVAGNGTAGNVDGAPTSAEFNMPTGITGLGFAQAYNMQFPNYPPNAYARLTVTDAGNFEVRTVCIPLGPNNGPQPQPCGAVGSVTTLAGSGQQGTSNGTGTSASMSYLGIPDTGATPTASSSMFVDTANGVIRQLTTTGTVTTVSSTTPGFTNGPLSSAQFAYPASITSDGRGNLLVADTGNSVIRLINSSSIVSTMTGNGTQGYQDGPASSAEFSGPIQALYNPSDGYTYVSDSQNNCIRRVDSSGTVSTYAGMAQGGYTDGAIASAQFSHPSGLALQGNFLYVSDTYNDVIRQINLSTGQVSTLID